jgi:hypothetical protein
MNIGHPKNSADGMQAKGTPCVKCENKHGAYNGGKVKSFSSGRIKLFGRFGFWGMGGGNDGGPTESPARTARLHRANRS